MNSLTTARANRFSNSGRAAVVIFGLVLVLIVTWSSAEAFEIDLSRRRRDSSKREGAVPTVHKKSDGEFFLDLFNPGETKQELVILNTGKGFVPSKIALRKGSRYTVHVVNVNENEKNVSFILDSFSEHHATFYGKIKSFEIKPVQEGVYTYQCPETSFEGKFVVFSPDNSRGLATDKDN